MSPPKLMPEADVLRSMFLYETDTGLLLRRVARGKAKAGEPVGRLNKGYVYVYVDGASYPAHRIIWKIVTGKEPDAMIDHADGDKTNNRWDNLRQASASENNMNRAVQSNNTSGYKGVCFEKSVGRWKANIRIQGRKKHLGMFATAEAAAEAYRKAANDLHGDFAKVE